MKRYIIGGTADFLGKAFAFFLRPLSAICFPHKSLQSQNLIPFFVFIRRMAAARIKFNEKNFNITDRVFSFRRKSETSRIHCRIIYSSKQIPCEYISCAASAPTYL